MNIFTKHPHSVNETYIEHMSFALKFGFGLVGGGLACIVHAIFPFLFEKSGSQTALHAVESFVSRSNAVDENDRALLVLIELRKKK